MTLLKNSDTVVSAALKVISREDKWLWNRGFEFPLSVKSLGHDKGPETDRKWQIMSCGAWRMSSMMSRADHLLQENSVTWPHLKDKSCNCRVGPVQTTLGRASNVIPKDSAGRPLHDKAKSWKKGDVPA